MWGKVGFDKFAQIHLYMGVYPMAPFPDADHSLAPSAETDGLYVHYGNLFRALKGRDWVLDAHAASCEGAKVNAFSVGPRGGLATGRVWPVMMGAANTTVTLQALAPQQPCTAVETLLPGAGKRWTKAAELVAWSSGVKTHMNVTVELGREGCALVRCVF